MSKVFFNVASKSIRSLGRESVSTAEGGLVELIKNSYDADSNICYIFFDIPFDGIAPDVLQKHEYNFLKLGFENLGKNIDNYFSEADGVYQVINSIDSNIEVILDVIKSLSIIYVIDDGDGMDSKTIQENWMTISTNNKEKSYVSDHGRLKNGSKGIGRFALDRLGKKCDLISFNKNNNSNGIFWSVFWDDFEGEDKLLTEVSAELSTENSKFNIELENILGIKHSILGGSKNGTIIKISDLRDLWDNKKINKAFLNLSKVQPPNEQNGFELYLQSSFKDYGFVKSLISDNFDYKVETIFTGKEFKIKIIRNEFEISTFPYEIFSKYDFFKGKEHLYSEDYIRNKEVNYTLSIKEIAGNLDKGMLEKLGPFEFNYFFLKKLKVTDKKYGNIYHQKNIISSHRKEWLDSNAGIRIYRDNFKVKPYGEHETSSWDWLKMGERLAGNPAQASRKGWKSAPGNIAGFVSISRIDNSLLVDKANREGIIENEYYDLLREVLLSLISQFEIDRSNIFRALKDHGTSIHKEQDEIEKSTKTTDDLLDDRNKKQLSGEEKSENRDEWSSDDYKDKLETAEKDIDSVLTAYENLKREKVKLTHEVSISNALASKGLIFNTLHHEILASKSKVNDRIASLKYYIFNIVKLDESDFESEQSLNKNPFLSLQGLESNFLKMSNWISFAFGSIQSNKRDKKLLNLEEYLQQLEGEWSFFLKKEKINFAFESDENVQLNIKIMDIDTIFNNLIINSIEALNSCNLDSRDIKINIIDDGENIIIQYSDSGPGLDKSVKDTNWFFESNNTTKKGEGTGIGLWILKTTVDNYDGGISVDRDSEGFNLQIKF